MSSTRWSATTWIRLIGNAVNGSTAFGLAVAAVGRARFAPGPRGLVLAEGYRLRFPVAGAFTIGNVLITGQPSWATCRAERPGVLRHEERHAWQWLACGPLFLPLYAAAMGWSWLATGDRAAANAFEIAAGLADGGYPSRFS